MHIDIVADVICPWCYIGQRRLERALERRPGIDARPGWYPFQLDPDMPPGGMPREAWLTARFGGVRQAARVYDAAVAAGEALGIGFAFDRIRRAPNTMAAHRLILRAAAKGRGGVVAEALFHAYFVAALDIGDLDVLAGVAATAGLDAAATRAWLAGPAGIEEVRAADRRARHLGIRAVPCFVFDGDCAIAGAQEPEFFLPLIDLGTGKERRALAAD